MDTRSSPTPPATARPKNSSSSIASGHGAGNPSQPTAMASSSRTAARGGTPTARRSASTLGEPADKPARPASRDSIKQKMLKKSDEAPRSSKSEEQLKSLKADFDSLRSNLTCKICDRLLYQPYTIACGHTYCYTCLCTWFVNNKNRKTCPDCRVIVKDEPAPAYVIRDMTNIFISRAELLPQGESLEDHQKWQQEEADAVQQDKENRDIRSGGLFKGCFKVHPLHGRAPPLQVLRDQEDGVDRCPVCTWELEDGSCQQCGLIFDEAGEVSWGDSFTGFSDMDEMSEQDTEDLDADMEEADFGDYDDAMGLWPDYLPGQSSFVLRRFLEGGGVQNGIGSGRRRMTHSEAGSRRSYSQSVASDLYGDEMDTVEEEDEEDESQAGSLAGFIDDEHTDADMSTSTASSTPAPESRPRNRVRARPIVESETSSTISSIVEEEDEEDEEDQGPIRRGQRHRNQSRTLSRANGSTSSQGPPSSTSTDVSTEEQDEDTAALLREEGWMLQQDDDEMGEFDEDSDGGRTTVGWEPLANPNDRSRMGGSLTPTADRPRPSAPIRPPSRVGDVRFMNASRGLRRRSSVLSTSTATYDNEADDDESEQDVEITQAMNSLRTRRSRLHLQNAAGFASSNGRFLNRAFPPGLATGDPDADDNSDTSQPGNSRRAPRMQPREYDPRISWLFANHQRALQEHQMAGALIDIEPRSITPITRPRTSNRNRPSPAQAYSPFLPPTRLRTPLIEDTLGIGPGPRMTMSPPRRSAASPALPTAGATGLPSRFDRAPSVSSTSTGPIIHTPGTSTPSSQFSIDSIAQSQTAAAMDVIDRPQSRVNARPPSANGRRTPGGYVPGYAPHAHPNIAMHAQHPNFPVRAQGNPWAASMQARNIRNRSSRQVLREQSSTATLRPIGSRPNIREVISASPTMRTQASRLGLRPQSSRRQLNTQASTRTLRASEHARPPQSPAPNAQSPREPTARPTNATQPDQTRVRQLIEARQRALNQTNPFTQGFQRPANPTAVSAANSTPVSILPTPLHTRSNSNDSTHSANSSSTTHSASASPALSRRRSTRNMGLAPPPGVLPPSQAAFTSPVTAYAQGYYRGRHAGAAPGAYEGPLHGHGHPHAGPAGLGVMAGPLI